MSRADDLAPLLASSGDNNIGFRQGTIVDWDLSTGSNTVQVGGAQLTDLPTMSMNGQVILYPGDVVGILKVRSQYFILGRIDTVNNQRMNYISTGSLYTSQTKTTVLPSTTSSTDDELLFGYVLRGTDSLLMQAGTVVDASTQGVFTFWINNVQVASSGTYSAGSGFFQANVAYPDSVLYNTGVPVQVKARRTSGTGKLYATWNALFGY
jgi:hypothetical protein